MTRLITIPFSHYCEKARWALERCGVAFDEDGHAPLFHYLPVRRAGGHRTVPLLVDGDTLLTDSTDIVAWADAKRPGMLIPADRTRTQALALEDDFDRQLGPAARRVGYASVFGRKDMRALVARDIPRWQVSVLGVAMPLAVRLLRRGLNITPAGVARSYVKIDATFARVGELLADGRPYLCGDRFTVADLTFAALSAPVLAPEGHPYRVEPQLAPDVARRHAGWRASPAGRHAQRMYADHRKRFS